MKFMGYRTLKTGVGSVIAMIIAQKLGIEYSASAGIITILSIQSTRKQSIEMALKRIYACVLALLISFIFFKSIGYDYVVFGVFLLIFIPLTVKFNLQEGIVVSSVLVTHLLVEKSVSLFWIGNELSLMVVGIGVALILNLYMPNTENKIKQDQIYIEEKMKEILFHMAEALKEHYTSIKDDELFDVLEKKLKSTRKRAYKNLNNYFLLDVSYYVQYIEMRIKQFKTMKRMKAHFQHFFMTYEQTIMISDFTIKVANSIYEENTALNLLNDVEVLRKSFKEMALPSTRDEFENRAMLIQFLNDMEEFIRIKNEFRENLL
ncbi:aromatic acid exporter family protein [Clostridium sp. MB40-C1]|uniref:aromatic acid exporter family protein n=1 Tax=Clostridium sp. MB40-C1 TaxID=3070996 RepID=UPI0027DEB87E|nr:aromatic acid exporter family protein [Clostridium sp. MB40-C1]WMJ81713.1 aromatic acid exporter family protein [Clostridium sp. MB40-C1]